MIRKALVCVLVICACTDAKSTSSTCQKSDCPYYSVVANYRTYELRKYDPTTWVKTQGIYNGNMRRLKFSLFIRLFKYIRGENDQRVLLNMTAPVLSIYEPGLPVQPNSNTKVTMYFMLPKSSWGNAPVPTDPEVKLDPWSETQFYVRSYGGYADEATTLIEYNALRNALGYNSNYAITAGYDKPSKTQNRHNEIWFLKV